MTRKTMQRLLWAIALLVSAILPLHAQEATESGVAEQRLIAHSRAFFVPHWFVGVQAGGAADVGEATFSQLLSPAVQFSTGYNFTELFGVRGTLSGFWARNRYAYPAAKYRWNFIQPAVEARLNLSSLLLGMDPYRKTHVYLFGGAGVAYSFSNDKAVAADKRYGIDFQKLWRHDRWNPVFRAGVEADFQLTEQLALSVEANANLLPDHFNSKLGRKDNKDWHFNALVGVTYSIGKTHGRTEEVYETYYREVPRQVVRVDTVVVEKPVEPAPVVEEKIEFTVNVQFAINQSVIRSGQMPKLYRLVRYLNEHPNAYVRLSGYADRETGNSEINERLSRERTLAVSQWLQSEGIDEERIRRFALGDRVQPFDLPEDNRVTICFVYNPKEQSQK